MAPLDREARLIIAGMALVFALAVIAGLNAAHQLGMLT